jgi:hypothetical protein
MDEVRLIEHDGDVKSGDLGIAEYFGKAFGAAARRGQLPQRLVSVVVGRHQQRQPPRHGDYSTS